jgi:hypothetical protein
LEATSKTGKRREAMKEYKEEDASEILKRLIAGDSKLQSMMEQEKQALKLEERLWDTLRYPADVKSEEFHP